MTTLVSDWSGRQGLLVGILIGAALLLLLQLYDGKRFHWAGRVLAGAVALAYAAYFIDELAVWSFRHAARTSGDAAALKAFAGLLVIGLPAGVYAVLGRWTFKERASDIEGLQRAMCDKHAVKYSPCAPLAKVGVSDSALRGDLPLNGLRHSPEGDTSGWYIWGGEELSTAPDFFKPIHAHHLAELRPEVLAYLGLSPGWRFLVAPGVEDIWFDESLL